MNDLENWVTQWKSMDLSRPSQIIPFLYKRYGVEITLLLVYVDDTIVTCYNIDEI